MGKGALFGFLVARAQIRWPVFVYEYDRLCRIQMRFGVCWYPIYPRANSRGRQRAAGFVRRLSQCDHVTVP